MPSFANKVRVEVYLPRLHARPYRTIRAWLIDELTALRGGCTVQEHLSGHYRSQAKEFVEDHICVVYSDFDMDWSQPTEQADVLDYCATLRQFLVDNLLEEEEILISAYPVSPVNS